MIADHIRYISKYGEVIPYSNKIEEFITYYRAAELGDGRYDILGDNLFALVQSYETKSYEIGVMESHKEYIDLQYIEKGKEVLYWEDVENLKVIEDQTPQKDIVFYERSKGKGKIVLGQHMFVYLLPHDAHMPCCQLEEKGRVKKIVFKISKSLLK